MTSNQRIRRLIIAAGIGLFAAFAGSAVYDGWRLHEQIMLSNEREIGNLAKALADRSSRNLQSVDLVLRDTVGWWETVGHALPPEAISTALASRVAGVSQITGISLVDAQGLVRHRSGIARQPQIDVSDRPYFQVQRDQASSGFYVNKPIVTRTEQVPSLVMSRRLSKPGGAFDGVVTASITLKTLQRYFSSLDIDEGSAVLMTFDDGALVLRQPPIAGFEAGRHIPQFAVFKDMPRVNHLISPLDGRLKLVAAQRVVGQPLMLTITRDEEQALRPWHDGMRSAAIRTLLLGALVVLAIWGLLRQLKRLEMAEIERAALQARLNDAERLESLGTMAGGIAHDFNNILGAILGFGELAQQHAEPGSPMRRYVDRVIQAGSRAKVLVRQILDFSRSGLSERVPVHIQAVVEEALAMLRPTLPEGVRVNARLEADMAMVLGDGTQLYQVVMNLCTNGFQAIEDAGMVEVVLDRTTLDRPTPLLHVELAPGAYVRLGVSDTGCGMSPDVLRRAFDPFFTTKKTGQGTGLGLSMVHGIVRDLGGGIDVATAPGQGTRITVLLPLSGEADLQAARLDPDWPIGQGQVVMVVDDERPLLELAEELLAELGYEPVGFDSSEGALEAFKASPHHVDIVLTDENLPGIKGTELATLLIEMRPDLPVILLSGNVDAALEQRAIDVGTVALLRKPLALQELAEVVSRTLDSRSRATVARC